MDRLATSGACVFGAVTAAAIRAYLYVNGEYFSNISHSFSKTTDVLNELRIETKIFIFMR